MLSELKRRGNADATSFDYRDTTFLHSDGGLGPNSIFLVTKNFQSNFFNMEGSFCHGRVEPWLVCQDSSFLVSAQQSQMTFAPITIPKRRDGLVLSRRANFYDITLKSSTFFIALTNQSQRLEDWWLSPFRTH